MKRKLVGLILALAVSTCLGACSDQGSAGKEGQVESGTATASSESEAEESKESQSGTENPGGESGAGEENGRKDADRKQFAGRLLSAVYGSKVYCLDDSGNGVKEYSWEDITSGLKKKGFDLKDATIMNVADGIAYCYLYESVGQGYQINVFAVDLEAKDVTKVWSVDPDWNLDNLDFYKDTLYATYYSYGDNGLIYREKAFTKASGKLEYQEKSGLSENFYSGIDGCSSLFLEYATAEGTGDDSSMSRILDGCGYVIGRQNDQYVMIYADGRVRSMSRMPEDYIYIDSYDENYVIYQTYDEEWNMVLNVMDIRTGRIQTVEDLTGFLDYEDGMVYYYADRSEDFVLKKNVVYRLDLAKETTDVLYEMESVPGATDIQPGTQSFRVLGGRIFFEKVEGDACKWFRVDPDDGKVAFQDLGCTIDTINAFRYGNVIHDGMVKNCKFCGIALEKYYGEAFQLDPKYSAEYRKINEALAAELAFSMQSNYTENEYEETDDACEEHQEYPDMYCETDEEYVTDVRIYRDRYLMVDTNGYWYAGGAHGMPYIGQHVFDLSTGEEMSVRDFYQGSEKDFKELVARKTKEDFESYSWYESPYFSDDGDDIYNTAYEYADLDATQVIFGEDGVFIMYQPYEMGPFASGFIEVWISYEEFLGRGEL